MGNRYNVGRCGVLTEQRIRNIDDLSMDEAMQIVGPDEIVTFSVYYCLCRVFRNRFFVFLQFLHNRAQQKYFYCWLSTVSQVRWCAWVFIRNFVRFC